MGAGVVKVASQQRVLMYVNGLEGGGRAFGLGMEGGGVAGAGGSGSGDDPEASGSHDKKKKRYHRHTARQIQELEAVFKECPHPDEKQRLQLSGELGLEPRQIKFWFQNRRTQMKAQHERADNFALRSENDKIRCENIVMREALKNVICPSCGSPQVSEDSYLDEHNLGMENLRLKAELDRISSIAAKYVGRPISQLPPIQPISISSLDLTVGNFGAHGPVPPPLDLDLMPGTVPIPQLQLQTVAISEVEKSLMVDVAANAAQEVVRLLQTDEPLWMKSSADVQEILNIDAYERIFSKPSNSKNPNRRIEASRDSGLVFMSGLALVNMFMDSVRWMEFFSTIVPKARTLEVLASGMSGNKSGGLQLMYEEMQVLSPLLPAREFYFLRCCQQVEQGLWVIADVSFDFSGMNQFAGPSRSRRRPSGCLIQDMSNGYSKVIWVEHVETEGDGTQGIYRDLVSSGLAFGAQRWLSTLQRVCERYASLMVTEAATRDLGGVPSPEGKRSLMKLSQRMVANFCASLKPSSSQRWTTLSGMNDTGIRITVHKSSEPGKPNGVVLSAAASIWLPVSPQSVFNFFRDERTRSQWDVLSNDHSVQEVAHVRNGSNPGNCISVLRAFNANHNMLILQESCIDSSGSIVVYTPLDLPAINIAMSGEDPSYIPLLPSGFTILPDGREEPFGGAASTSSCVQGGGPNSSGSLITVAFQIVGSSLPTARLNLESVNTINNLISTTVRQIKSALI